MPKRIARHSSGLTAICAALVLTAAGMSTAWAEPFLFSTGAVNDLLAAASRPDNGARVEIESADDFVLAAPTTIASATSA